MSGNIHALPKPGWKDRAQTSSTGALRTNVYNACLAVRDDPAFRGAIWFDEFAMKTMVSRAMPWNPQGDRAWTNHDDNAITEWLQGADLNVGRETAQIAVETVAFEQRRHPVREYLDGLKWDGQARLSNWLTYYLGVDPTDYAQAVGSAWMISAVARILQPGCKADHVLVLEGPQGLKKSTAARTLANGWFTDEIAELGSKDAGMQMRGVWIIELSEMDHMTRSEAGRIKAFLSRGVDRFRPAYGSRVVEAPRECVFVGTVNLSEYLKDETGNRRFWPVTCTAIDIDALDHDRDQLWAEAVHRYRSREPWWIVDHDIVASAAEEQKGRNESDAWEEIVDRWLSDNPKPPDFAGFLSSEILTNAIGKKQQDIQTADNKRIGKIMVNLGFEKKNQRIGKSVQKVWKKRIE